MQEDQSSPQNLQRYQQPQPVVNNSNLHSGKPQQHLIHQNRQLCHSEEQLYHPHLHLAAAGGQRYGQHLQHRTYSNLDLRDKGGKEELPDGWEAGQDFDGRVYYIDHKNQRTTWEHPAKHVVDTRSKHVVDTRSKHVVDTRGSDATWRRGEEENEEKRFSQSFGGDAFKSRHSHSASVSQLPPVGPSPFFQQQPQLYHQNQRQPQIFHQHQTSEPSPHRIYTSEQPPPLGNRIDLQQGIYHDNMSSVMAAAASSSVSSFHQGYEQPQEWQGQHQQHYRQDVAASMQYEHQQQPPYEHYSGENLEWRHAQRDMLRQYLATAETDIRAKQELAEIKQQRLNLAQEEFQHLRSTLTQAVSASTTSLNSIGGTKYDLDLLKSDVQHARARVHRLKSELANIGSEVTYKQQGMDTLAIVSAKYAEDGQLLTMEEARAIRNELSNIQRSLTSGEAEKADLMKSLACLKDELVRLQNEDSNSSESSLNNIIQDQDSTASSSASRTSVVMSTQASQTDLAGEMVPIGARLAEMARLRLQYDETRRHVREIQSKLVELEEKLNPGQLESDQDRLLLIQDKEQLLRELRSINLRSKSEREVSVIKSKIRGLQIDLAEAMESSNKSIADRLRVYEERQAFLQRLRDNLRTASRLESRLKTLSASTLSMSSCSSLGSLSSSHASSKGSLSSLSFTDIYGLSSNPTLASSVGPTILPSGNSSGLLGQDQMLDLQKRVDRILNSSKADNGSLENQLSEQLRLSSNSLAAAAPSNKSSPSSVVKLSTIEESAHELAASGRESAEAVEEAPSPLPTTSSKSSPQHQKLISPTSLLGHLVQYNKREQMGLLGVKPSTSPSTTVSGGLISRGTSADSLSPISENTAMLSPSSVLSSGLHASSTSVAGCSAQGGQVTTSDADSGVFEAASSSTATRTSKTRNLQKEGTKTSSLSSSQVRIKLRYAEAEALLHIGVEEARNLAALSVHEGAKVCIRAVLSPAKNFEDDENSTLTNSLGWTFCTRAIEIRDEKRTIGFGETFQVCLAKSEVSAKSMQITIWALEGEFESLEQSGDEELGKSLLGSAQINLADFDLDGAKGVSVTKWYNVLSFKFMMPEGETRSSKQNTLKEGQTSNSNNPANSTNESSDESTVNSSQTSTLTRNIAPESLMAAAVNACGGGIIEDEFEESDEDDSDTENEDDQAVAAADLGNVRQQLQQTASDTENEDDQAVAASELGQLRQTAVEELDEDQLIYSLKVIQMDKETNTDCVFVQPSARPKQETAKSGLIRKTRNLAGGLMSKPASASYVCKVNRSDSDGAAMISSSIRLKRQTLERRSLRIPRQQLKAGLIPDQSQPSVRPKSTGKTEENPGTPNSSTKIKRNKFSQALETSLDLELDLAAQQTKLRLLQEEIDRLKEIKRRLEMEKSKGKFAHRSNNETELTTTTWLQEHEHFYQMIDKLQNDAQETWTKEERRLERMMRKSGRDIYKLRKAQTTARGVPDIQAFKEKMAFFSNLHSKIPTLANSSEVEKRIDSKEEKLEEKPEERVEKRIDSKVDTEEKLEEKDERRKTVPKVESKNYTEERFSYDIDPEIGVIV